MSTFSPEDKKKIKSSIVEISNSMTRMDAERDLIKEIVNEMHETFDIPKKTIKRMARIYHKQNFHTEQQEMEELGELYVTVVDTSSNP